MSYPSILLKVPCTDPGTCWVWSKYFISKFLVHNYSFIRFQELFSIVDEVLPADVLILNSLLIVLVICLGSFTGMRSNLILSVLIRDYTFWIPWSEFREDPFRWFPSQNLPSIPFVLLLTALFIFWSQSLNLFVGYSFSSLNSFYLSLSWSIGAMFLFNIAGPLSLAPPLKLKCMLGW